jgi:hypothetical protein
MITEGWSRLVRIPALHAGGHGFKSHSLHASLVDTHFIKRKPGLQSKISGKYGEDKNNDDNNKSGTLYCAITVEEEIQLLLQTRLPLVNLR